MQEKLIRADALRQGVTGRGAFGVTRAQEGAWRRLKRAGSGGGRSGAMGGGRSVAPVGGSGVVLGSALG
jgi:hypothetical protein